MVHKDYYQIMGLARNASPEQIKKAYRKLAMRYHPDRNQGKEKWANDKFKEVNEAFSVLGNPEKRRQYDQFGTVGNIGDIFGSQATRTTFEDLMKDFGGAGLGFGFLDNIFGNVIKQKGRSFSFQTFGRGFGGSRDMRFETQGGINLDNLFRQSQRPTPHNVNYEITITNKQATKGMEKVLVRKGKKIKIKIPAGVQTRNKIRLRNALNITDKQQGDIIINVKVK